MRAFPTLGKVPESRATVVDLVTREIDWEETAKTRADNPFLVNAEEEFVEVLLV